MFSKSALLANSYETSWEGRGDEPNCFFTRRKMTIGNIREEIGGHRVVTLILGPYPY